MTTKEEKSYLVQRINDISNDKQNAVRNVKPPKTKRLTEKQKIQKFLKGEYKVDENRHGDYSVNPYALGYWSDIIDFGEDLPTTTPYDEQNRICKEIKDEANKLKDEVMLGSNNDDLLKMLKDFANKEFK